MLTHWRTWPGREQSCYFCPQRRPRMGSVWTPIWACGSGGAGRGARSHSILVAAPLGLPPPLCLKSLLHAILSAGRKWGFKRCGENVLSHDLSKTFNSKRDFPLGCIRINFLAFCSKAHQKKYWNISKFAKPSIQIAGPKNIQHNHYIIQSCKLSRDWNHNKFY